MQTLLDLLGRMERLGSREAILFHNGYRTWRRSYEGLLSDAHAFAAHLEELGIHKGERVLLWGENRSEWAAAFWGCVERGVQAVPLDRGFSPDLAARIAGEVRARLVVADDARSEEEVERLRGEGARAVRFAEIQNLPRHRLPPAEISPEDIVEIVYTSGTTGRPRGVVHRHRNLCANLGAIGKEIDKYRWLARPFQPVRILVLLPLSHLFGQSLGLYIPVLLGGAAAFTTELSPPGVIDALRRLRISVLVGVPRILENLRHEAERTAGTQIPPARYRGWLGAAESWWRYRAMHRRTGFKFWAFVVGGARLDPALEQFWRQLGYVVVQGYGLTETSPVVALNHPFSTRAGSLGKALAGQQIRIAGDGEILIRGPSVVEEYLGGEDGSTRVEGGWLHTGDLAEVDAEGRLYFKGRKKDVIVRPDGLNVYPDDVEPVLKSLPGVRDAAVIGLDSGGGEQVHAVLLLDQGPNGDAAELVRQANARLEPYQRVQGWTVWPESDFPRTSSTWKVRRAEIRARLRSPQPEPQAPVSRGRTETLVREAVARRTGRKPEDLRPELTLDIDLALSSLDRIDLLAELEDRCGRRLDEFEYAGIQTVGALEAFVSEGAASPAAERVETGAAAAAAEQPGASPAPARQAVRVSLPRWSRGAPLRCARAFLQDFAILPMVRELVRLRVEGLENLAGLRPPVIFTANHVSHLDTGIVAAGLPRRWRRRLAPAMSQDYFRAWLEPRGEPLPDRLQLAAQYWVALGLFNAYPLPQRMGGTRRALQFTAELVESGYCPLVFPEGLRSPDGTIQPFQTGIGLMAVRLGVPVVPIHLDGVFEVYSVHHEWPQPGRVTMTVGSALEVPPQLDYAQAAAEVEKALRKLAADARQAG